MDSSQIAMTNPEGQNVCKESQTLSFKNAFKDSNCESWAFKRFDLNRGHEFWRLSIDSSSFHKL